MVVACSITFAGKELERPNFAKIPSDRFSDRHGPNTRIILQVGIRVADPSGETLQRLYRLGFHSWYHPVS